MSESQKHMDLVKLAYSWVQDSLPEKDRFFIEADTPETNQPNSVDGFIPDVYYEFDGQLYIGEAKTLNDFERMHSKQQYEAYLNRCEKYRGKSCLVITVPWQLQNTAKNYFRYYKMKHNCHVTVIVLTDIGTESIV